MPFISYGHIPRHVNKSKKKTGLSVALMSLSVHPMEFYFIEAIW